MKKGTILKCSGLFIILFVFSISYIALNASMRFRPSQRDIVFVHFESNETDWFDFYLRVEYGGNLVNFSISRSDEDREQMSIMIGSFKDPTKCFLLCKFHNYNLTIGKRDLMSNKEETLYENEGRSMKWKPAVMVVN